MESSSGKSDQRNSRRRRVPVVFTWNHSGSLLATPFHPKADHRHRDFGSFIESQVDEHRGQSFGVARPLEKSASGQRLRGEVGAKVEDWHVYAVCYRPVTIRRCFSLEQVRGGARLSIRETEEIAKKDAFRQMLH